MSTSFLQIFLTATVLSLVQFLAALPWLIALDRRILTALKRPQVLGAVLGANALLGLAAAFFIGTEPETVMRWGRGYMSALHLNFSVDFFLIIFVVMLKLWPKGGAVALAAFREGVRQPMFLLLLLPTLFFMCFILPFLPYFTLGEDIKMLKELGYDLLTLVGGLFAVIAAGTSISDEIEGRTAVTLMSKPIARRDFLLGKFVGVFLAALVLVVVLGWAMTWVFLFKEWFDPKIGQEKTPDPAFVQRLATRVGGTEGPTYDAARGILLWVDEAGAVLPGLVLVSCQVMVLLAIAVALATRLHFIVNFVVCAGFYFLGHLAPVLTAVSQNRNALVKFMANVFDVFMPGLEHFDMSGAVVRDTPLPAGEFGVYTLNVALYAVTYSVIALLFGLILFEDRDLA
jgi:ABC-type transport system involved in multi-copper enzyme maturation permease subunit